MGGLGCVSNQSANNCKAWSGVWGVLGEAGGRVLDHQQQQPPQHLHLPGPNNRVGQSEDCIVLFQ